MKKILADQREEKEAWRRKYIERIKKISINIVSRTN